MRVDVPGVDDLPEFTKLLGQGSIFSITPVSREVAVEAVKRFRSKPLIVAGYIQERLPCFDADGENEDEDDAECEDYR